MDSAPLSGGYTYFLNVGALSLGLAIDDEEAFESLFLPDALTIVRPRGKGALKVTTPALFLNEASKPQSFFRIASGEYLVRWADYAPLARARTYLERFAPAFSFGSSFVHMSAPGHCCLMDNQLVAHARSPFRDDPARGMTRVLSRKWFMRMQRDETYKHVPGMFLSSKLGAKYDAIRNPAILEGEWNYDAATDSNMRRDNPKQCVNAVAGQLESTL